MKSKYHIIWIDDEWEKMTSFMKNCSLEYQMELKPFKTQKDGLDEYARNPSYWEAVILDAKVLDEDEHEVPNIGNLQNAVTRINKQFSGLPYFISTGQPDLLDDDTFRQLFPNYYQKVVDDVKLCNDIINIIKDSPNRQIVDKYPDVFSSLESPIYGEMLSIIKIHENHEFNNADVFNKIRKVLDWIMTNLHDYGIDFNGKNLNDCSRCLSHRDLDDYVPVYIQRQVFCLVTVANEGSHNLKIDKDVKKSLAPYLVSATIFELCNVIIWYNQLPTDDEFKSKIKSVASIIMAEITKKSKRT